MSQIVKVKVQYHNKTLLTQAIESLGGKVLGQGTHIVYGRNITGWGFRLPNWNYPLVINDNDELIFDNYEGRWGDPKVLEELQTRYIWEIAKEVAGQHGWITITTDTHLTIFAEDGRTLTISRSGQIESTGFCGPTCAETIGMFVEQLGQSQETINTGEYYQRRVLNAVEEEYS